MHEENLLERATWLADKCRISALGSMLIFVLLQFGFTEAAEKSHFRRFYENSPDMPDGVALNILAGQQAMLVPLDYRRSVQMAMKHTGADEESAVRIVQFLVAFADNIERDSLEVDDSIVCADPTSSKSEESAQQALNTLDDLRVGLYERRWMSVRETLSDHDMRALRLWINWTKLHTTWAQLEHTSDAPNGSLVELEHYCDSMPRIRK